MLFRSGSFTPLVSSGITVNGVVDINAVGAIDAFRLTNIAGVASYSALGTGGTGSGHVLGDAGAWVSNATTVNGVSCALGGTCTPFLTGATGTITGTALTATCDSGTATVTGATVGHPVSVSTTDGTDVGGAFYLRASVTSTNTITVYVCGTGTPPSKAYNVVTQ